MESRDRLGVERRRAVRGEEARHVGGAVAGSHIGVVGDQ